MFCPNPIAFNLFGYDIHWYGILISLSVILAVFIAYKEANRKGIDTDTMLDYALLTVPIAIVFARIFYVVFEWEQYAANPIRALYIWEGGIAIYGAIFGGVIATLIFSKWKKLSFWTLADLVAPGLVLGQAIGRWGNFFNQEAFGELVTQANLQFFPYAVYIERLNEWHMATFFYESMTCLLIFIFLMIYRRKAKNAPDGNLFLWYWVLYGIERAYVEGLRTDSLWMLKDGVDIGYLTLFPNGLRVSQVVSIIMVIAFSIVLFVRWRKRDKTAIPAQRVVRVKKAPKQEVIEKIEEVDPSLVLIRRNDDDDNGDSEDDDDEEGEEAEGEEAEEAEITEEAQTDSDSEDTDIDQDDIADTDDSSDTQDN